MSNYLRPVLGLMFIALAAGLPAGAVKGKGETDKSDVLGNWSFQTKPYREGQCVMTGTMNLSPHPDEGLYACEITAVEMCTMWGRSVVLQRCEARVGWTGRAPDPTGYARATVGVLATLLAFADERRRPAHAWPLPLWKAPAIVVSFRNAAPDEVHFARGLDGADEIAWCAHDRIKDKRLTGLAILDPGVAHRR